MLLSTAAFACQLCPRRNQSFRRQTSSCNTLANMTQPMSGAIDQAARVSTWVQRDGGGRGPHHRQANVVVPRCAHCLVSPSAEQPVKIVHTTPKTCPGGVTHGLRSLAYQAAISRMSRRQPFRSNSISQIPLFEDLLYQGLNLDESTSRLAWGSHALREKGRDPCVSLGIFKMDHLWLPAAPVERHHRRNAELGALPLLAGPLGAMVVGDDPHGHLLP
jgi:hypothetical protein